MTFSPLRLLVAINPRASFGKKMAEGGRAVRMLREAGHNVVMLRESNVELLRLETEHAVAAGADALIVVGGDGMVSLAVNIVTDTGLPIGIVPTGTGNDLARGLGIPLDDTKAAVERILNALDTRPRTIDAARVNHGELTTWYAGVLSAGFDAIVNERANRMTRPRGPSSYILALVRELFVLAPIDYRVQLDGETQQLRGMLISVANNVSLGGGMKVTPDALLDDGLLDFFLVTPLGRLAFLRVFPSVFRGEHVNHPQVSIQRVRRVRLEAEGIVAYADGERVGPLPLDIEVVPGALRILA